MSLHKMSSRLIGPAMITTTAGLYCWTKYYAKRPLNTAATNRTATNYDEADNAAFYAQLKKDYNWFFTPLSDTLITQLKLLTENKDTLDIIDIACGDGNVSRQIIDKTQYLNKNNINIIGIDISESQIKIANENNKQKQEYIDCINYEIGNAEHIKYKNKFDIALCFWSFNYSTNTEILNKMMKSCYESLKDNGIAIGCTLSMNNPNQLKQLYDMYLNTHRIIFDRKDPTFDGDCWAVQLTKTKNNRHFEICQYFFHEATYDEIAKSNGFKNGIEFVNGDDFTYNGVKLTDKEKEIAYSFYASPEPLRMFILRK
eukprot:155805_1